ncbi:sensor domain-containing protein [Massilia horti]|uniref:EAL domain-containing protein n=1 Tax=Massilia horti TaxID=2562153 RepID=A0A4Y9T1J5_9BURK|nr:EAL domain-containing protein [Massilia horti]TFW31454.1 EAL domain-containing protein [Massilia horti]TFW31455.1 EAL domain-containing protein [Massilia horti]
MGSSTDAGRELDQGPIGPDRLEQEARSRCALLAVICEQMEQAAFILRPGGDGQLRFETVNQAFCLLAGLPREQVLGKRVTDVIPEAAQAATLAHLREALERAATVRWEATLDFPSAQKTGALAVTPAYDAHGQLVGVAGTVYDLTRASRLEAQLSAARAETTPLARALRMSGAPPEQVLARATLLARLARQAPGALFQLALRPDGRLHCPYISDAAQALFGCAPAEIEASFKCLLQCIPRRDRARLRRAMLASALRLQPWHSEFPVALPGDAGIRGWRELVAAPTRQADGTVAWHGFIGDISERKRIEETIGQFNDRLAKRVHYDPLTGLPNRFLFGDRLALEMKHAATGGHGMALLFIGLDRRKLASDLAGQDADEALLAYAARRIERCLQPGDTVARLGDDEFAVILTECGEVEHAELVAQRLIDVLRAPFCVGNGQAVVSASIGIAQYPDDGGQPERLMQGADQAMARARASGRNRLAFLEVGMQAAAMRRLRLASELRGALADGQLLLLFQPILDIRTSQITKAEALLRWRRAGHEPALPAGLFGIAEENGLIHEIGDWVFVEAARWAQRWSGMLGRRFQVSINKSQAEFEQPHHVPDWGEHWQCQVDPCIAVEIPEGMLQHLNGAMVSRLHELQAAGIEIAVDGFGTGYSSMSYLKRLAVDYLKIDKSFVAGMLHDQTSRTITETIIVMAHKLGLKVIAEGVEHERQRAWLAEQGCDYLQGYLFGQPVEAQPFERMLASQPFAAH